MPPASRQPTRGDYVSLKEHVESRIVSVEKSIEVANSVMQHRLAGMNEFRETLRDQAAKFTTREELEAKLNVLESRIKPLELSKATMEGKASQAQANISLLIALVGLVIAVIALLTR